jgi:uncharacterized protein (TIGR00297 family)
MHVPRVVAALVVTLIFAILGRVSHGVALSGAIAGAFVCFALYAGAGPGAFIALACVFAITWFVTRLGYRRKLKLGTAERKDGRNAAQVLANLATAGACAAVYGLVWPKSVLLLAVSASLSEAAADTVSSEIGQVSSDKARLITNWREVPAGTDGGITWLGSLTGLVAALLVSVVSYFVGLIPQSWIVISLLAAVVGVIFDSLLGATLERRRVLNNDAVNFLGTLVAAAIAFSLV